MHYGVWTDGRSMAAQVEVPSSLKSGDQDALPERRTHTALIVGGVAGAYFALAIAAQLFLHLPGLGTAMWPAAGVAFAAAAVFGWRALVGVAIGASAANLTWLVALDATEEGALASVALVGIGSVAQAIEVAETRDRDHRNHDIKNSDQHRQEVVGLVQSVPCSIAKAFATG